MAVGSTYLCGWSCVRLKGEGYCASRGSRTDTSGPAAHYGGGTHARRKRDRQSGRGGLDRPPLAQTDNASCPKAAATDYQVHGHRRFVRRTLRGSGASRSALFRLSQLPPDCDLAPFAVEPRLGEVWEAQDNEPGSRSFTRGLSRRGGREGYLSPESGRRGTCQNSAGSEYVPMTPRSTSQISCCVQ